MVSSDTTDTPPHPVVDFSNTEIAFAHKSNQELRRSSWLFRLMNKSWLVTTGSTVGLWLHDRKIPVLNPLIRATIFRQFCGGISLDDTQKAIDHLAGQRVLTILDFGAEGKSREEDFYRTLEENVRAIRFAASSPTVPVISSKVTALAAATVLEKHQSGQSLTTEEQTAFDRAFDRVDTLCRTAWEQGVAVFIDAEETWIQDTIDLWVKLMMERYNKERVTVYHTYQLYRKDKLGSLVADHQEAKGKGYLLGAKIVRGAYMEKERNRAADLGYPSPIHDTAEDTHRDFDAAVEYCVEHYMEIASCNASHNLRSNLLQAELIAAKGIVRDHPHLNFCQLYGMSDYITFNLAKAGYTIAKYVPYGPVKDVVPYLMRRALENTSVTGEMSRELSLIVSEMKRRGMV